jgi:desulfoferrodoxin (superoxide reductase-like protein)
MRRRQLLRSWYGIDAVVTRIELGRFPHTWAARFFIYWVRLDLGPELIGVG